MAFKPLFGQQKIFYGADYNPEQWLKYPDILKADPELMQQMHCSVMSVGMFSWSKLEPEEGRYDFEWLKQTLDRLNEHGIRVFLSTPSGARPVWMSHKHPEVLRTGQDGVKAMQGGRHNHCMSSQYYRDKVKAINTALAKEFGHHPAVMGWHLSNEYGGYCYCDKCKARFREWLKEKYGTIEALNEAWWTTFWSHIYSSFDEVEPPMVQGEMAVHGLNLDWKRFTSWNAQDFMKAERDTVKAITPDLPVTANFMEYFWDYDYFEWAKDVDFISWDSYPKWHFYENDNGNVAAYTAMNHDLMRSYKGGQPFVLMESTPSCTNWRELSTLKKPGMNTLASLQAVAHGADSVQYFQWRKSRGSSEKFHGAIIDHSGSAETRVARECKSLGEILDKLGGVAGASTPAKVAIVYDLQNRWGLEDSQGPRNQGLDYLKVCLEYYRPLWERGISVDVIDETCPLDNYKLVIAPMTYMIRGDYAQRVQKFVEQGGTYVSTFWSGIVNDTDLCFLGGFPGPLREVLGIYDEEIDSFADDVRLTVQSSAALGKSGSAYEGRMLCALIHPEKAQTMLSFAGMKGRQDNDAESLFFKDKPALTVNAFGKGQAYYVSARMNEAFNADFIDFLSGKLGLEGALPSVQQHPEDGVSAQVRVAADGTKYIFAGNYNSTPRKLVLDRTYHDVLKGCDVPAGEIELEPFGVRVFTA